MIKLIMKQVEDTKVEKVYTNFYVVLENGNRVQVKPAFKEDFVKLRLIAEKE